MKICYIANANNIHTYRWIAPFIEKQYKVYLLSPVPVERRWPGLEQLVDLTKLYDKRKWRFVYWGLWANRYLKRIRPDIVHAHQLVGPSWVGVIANYHPFIASGWGSDILVEPHKSTLRRILLKLVLNRSDQITVPSELMYNATRVLGVPNAKLHLVPWGVETEIFQSTPDDRIETRKKYGIDQTEKVILCSRAIAPLYNIDILVKVGIELLKSEKRFRLVLVRYNMQPEYYLKIQQMIVDCGLEQVVLWLPPQKNSFDMAKLYRMADVTVSIPSSEGYGFTVYEAMACGCPTIISDLPIHQAELINGVHTLKVRNRDALQISQTLFNLFEDPNLQHQLRQNGLLVCRDKSVTNRIQQTARLYQEVVLRADQPTLEAAP